MNVNYFTIPLALVAVIGTLLIIKKKKEGWLLWEIECGGLLGINLWRGDFGEALLWTFYFIINIIAYREWKKNDVALPM